MDRDPTAWTCWAIPTVARGGAARAPRRWDAGGLPELRSSELKLTAGGLEARGRQREFTLEVLGDRGGVERAVDDDQRVVDGEL